MRNSFEFYDIDPDFALNSYHKLFTDDDIHLYFLPFRADYPTVPEDGNAYDFYYRDYYSSRLEGLDTYYGNSGYLMFNKEDLMSDKALKEYYIDKLGINNFIVTNEKQYQQIKKINPKANILYMEDIHD